MAVKNIIETEEHHRRPRSLGGKSNSGNISYVIPKHHKYWHTLFGNMNAYQITDELIMHYKPSHINLVCTFINGTEVHAKGGQNSKKNTKCRKSWNELFKDMTFEEAIQYINNTWLDPSYHIYIKY